jgi:hypothetical protein
VLAQLPRHKDKLHPLLQQKRHEPVVRNKARERLSQREPARKTRRTSKAQETLSARPPDEQDHDGEEEEAVEETQDFDNVLKEKESKLRIEEDQYGSEAPIPPDDPSLQVSCSLFRGHCFCSFSSLLFFFFVLGGWEKGSLAVTIVIYIFFYLCGCSL